MNSKKNPNKTASRRKSKQLNRNINRNDGAIAEPFGSTRLPFYRPLTLAIPDKMFTRLKYTGFGYVTMNIGVASSSKRYRPTSAYDVDPALGSTSTPGFSELAALYNSYRVTRSKIRVSVVPCNTNGLSIVVLPLNSDPGAAPTGATIQSWPGNPYAKYRLLTATGGPQLTIVNTMSTEQIFGSKAVYFDDNFASLVTTNPLNNWYWAIGFLNNSAVSGSNLNIDYLTEIEMDVEFFCRSELLV